MGKDYYSILGVNKNASEEDIKKAYRNLSLKYHPDRHANDTEKGKKEAEEKFKEINEAYNTLSDPDKKRKYDTFGHANNNANPFTDFGGFKAGGFGFDPFGFWHETGEQFAERVEKGSDIRAEVVITLEDSYKGVRKTVEYQQKKKCKHCNGTGSEDGRVEECPECHGTGHSHEYFRNGNFTQVKTYPCPYCHGKGTIIRDACHECGGEGTIYEWKEVTIDIPEGTFDGTTIVMSGLGDEPLIKGVNGDLYIVIKILNDTPFKRVKNNIEYDIKLTIEEAWCGCEKTVPHLDGTEVKITIPELTKYTDKISVSGRGFKNPQNGDIGDFVVNVNYEIPDKITDKQKELLKEFCKIGK